MLHYRITGRPFDKTIVLIHGYLSDMKYWQPLLPTLEASYRVIRIDLLGFGDSPKPRRGYDLSSQTTQVARMIETLAPEQSVDILAHSMGSLIAANLALRYPQLVARLTLANPPVNNSPEQVRHTLRSTSLLYQLGLYSPLSRIMWPPAKLIAKHSKHAVFRYMSHQHTHHSRQGSLRLIESCWITDILQVIDVTPITIICGTYDRPHYQKNLRALPLKPTVRIHWVDTGHHTVHRAPDEILRHLL